MATKGMHRPSMKIVNYSQSCTTKLNPKQTGTTFVTSQNLYKAKLKGLQLAFDQNWERYARAATTKMNTNS